MHYFIAIADTGSLSEADWQLIEALAPFALLLFVAGALSWVVDIIKHFWR